VGEDREIRAKDFAEMAIYAIIHFADFREIVALKIKGLGHPEHIARTVLDAKLAALTPFFDHGHLSLGNPDGLQVKGNTPIFHTEVPLLLSGVEKSFSGQNDFWCNSAFWHFSDISTAEPQCGNTE